MTSADSSERTGTKRERLRVKNPAKKGAYFYAEASVGAGSGNVVRKVAGLRYAALRVDRQAPLDGSRSVGGRDTCRARLAHSHSHALDGETLDERVRYGSGERLDQVELPAVGHFAHTLGDLAVIDGVLDPVGEPGVAHFEPHVVEEVLSFAALLVEHAVAAEDLQGFELDDHPTAAATVSASTCSRTSCTRKIVAPRS